MPFNYSQVKFLRQHIFYDVLLKLGSHSSLEITKCEAHLREGLQGGSRRQQTCQFEVYLVQDNQEMRPSQHGFVKRRSYLTDLISFYEKVSHLVDQGKFVHVIYLYFSKASDIVFHSILQKLAAHSLERCLLFAV